jgi:predicted Rossmann fold nucleotide-binding protein DprA/Smf involved in DNA uptake
VPAEQVEERLREREAAEPEQMQRVGRAPRFDRGRHPAQPRPATRGAQATPASGIDIVPTVHTLPARTRGSCAVMIRAVARSDREYPHRLRDVLGAAAPSVLFVAGPLTLCNGPLLGVVGSRDVDHAGAALAAAAGRAAVAHGWGVVSGGATGVDRAAMDAALAAGGRVVAFLADPLRGAAEEPAAQEPIEQERLCLASPYGPDEPYTPERAHGRNPLIFATARVTLVVASEAGGSSTWLGAVGALERGDAVAAWTGPGAWPGNADLVRLGARPVEDLADLWAQGP